MYIKLIDWNNKEYVFEFKGEIQESNGSITAHCNNLVKRYGYVKDYCDYTKPVMQVLYTDIVDNGLIWKKFKNTCDFKIPLKPFTLESFVSEANKILDEIPSSFHALICWHGIDFDEKNQENNYKILKTIREKVEHVKVVVLHGFGI